KISVLSPTAKRLAVCGEVVHVVEDDRIRRISRTASLGFFLEALDRWALAFGMKVRDQDSSGPCLPPIEAAEKVNDVLSIMQESHKQAVAALYTKERQTNGPDGAFPSVTRKSTALLVRSLRELFLNTNQI